MKTTCPKCGATANRKPSHVRKFPNRVCKKCYDATRGSTDIACERCGKIRRYKNSEIEKKGYRHCWPCLQAIRAERRIEITCPRCGRKKSVSPSALKFFYYGGGHCRSCDRVYDETLPDTYDAGYVVGVMLGDGHLFTNRRRSNNRDGSDCKTFGLRLAVKSEAFAREFAARLEQACERKPWMRRYAYWKKGSPKIRMPSGFKTDWIVIGGGRGWYEKILPIKKGLDYDRVRNMGREFKRGFVQGMIDSEGYINERYTDVANKNIGLLNLLVELLAEVGCKAKVYGPYSYSRGVAHLRIGKPLHKNE